MKKNMKKRLVSLIKKEHGFRKALDEFHYNILPKICAIYMPIGFLWFICIVYDEKNLLVPVLVLFSIALSVPYAVVGYVIFFSSFGRGNDDEKDI